MKSSHVDWSDIAYESKKPLRDLKAIFIAAPREISTARFTQIIKTYLPQANIILGISKEPYIDGFEGQPQFSTLQQSSIQLIIDKVNTSSSKHTITTVSYLQRELIQILEKLKPRYTLFVNGSWKFSFHTLPVYYHLVNNKIAYELISPFVSTDEAQAYEARVEKDMKLSLPKSFVDEKEVLDFAQTVAKQSFDYGFQTGVVLAGKSTKGYGYIEHGFNKVVPYQAYALHHGSSREIHFSPSQDLNHYDTIHAEMDLLVKLQRSGVALKNTALFINLLPCPNCARTLSTTDISEIVYQIDHSNGYALDLLEKSGKTVRRIV